MSSESLDLVYRSIDEQHAGQPAATRRQLVGGAAATLGGLGLLSLPGRAIAQAGGNSPQTILNVAASAEVVATIINTVGAERVDLGDAVTLRNVRAAAREELLHYEELYRRGGRTASKRIWIPDAVFSNRTSFLNAVQVGDQIFINAYLIGTKTFGNAGNGALALIAAEFMGVEAVHRALARQSLGLLGNDRIFIKYDGRETATGAPDRGQFGFEDVTAAVQRLQAAGIGFGTAGRRPGQFYDFDAVRRRTPTDPDLNTPFPDFR
jgi:hypothetical protein